MQIQSITIEAGCFLPRGMKRGANRAGSYARPFELGRHEGDA